MHQCWERFAENKARRGAFGLDSGFFRFTPRSSHLVDEEDCGRKVPHHVEGLPDAARADAGVDVVKVGA
jgi:hypothetical protein